MATRIPFYEVVKGKHLECEELWFLVVGHDGKKCVMREVRTIDPMSKAPERVKSRRLAISRVLAEDDDVAARLRATIQTVDAATFQPLEGSGTSH